MKFEYMLNITISDTPIKEKLQIRTLAY